MPFHKCISILILLLLAIGFYDMKKLILRYVNQNKAFANAGLLVVGIVLSLPAIAFAQADTSKKLKQVEILSSQLPVVQSIVPTQQIRSTDFARYGALTVADAIRDFAGVNIKDYGGIGGLKTVSVRSLGANHLAVFYDGVELSDVQNGQIDLGKLNLNSVQSITLYNAMPAQICQPARAFAAASVLAITTVNPKLDSIKPYQVTLGVNGGSFSLVNPYLQWQQRLSKTWSFIVNGYIEHTNGKYKYKVDGDGSDTLATRNNGDVNVQQTDAALYYTKSDNNKFNLHVNYYNSERGLPGAVVYYNPYSASRLQNQDLFIQASYARQWKSGLNLLINSKFSQDYIRYTDPNFLNSTGGLDQQYTQREFYQSAALAYSINANWQVSYAADAAYAKLDANLPNYLYPNRFTLLNVLASDLKVGKFFLQTSLLASNIYERVSSGNVAAPVWALSPTLVVNYYVNPQLQLRAFYKDIFRVPTFNEQYFFAIVNIRNIKPENAKQFDVGISYSKSLYGLFSYITFTADGYFNRVTNKIISLPNQNLAISSIINLGRVDIKGADAGLKAQLNISTKWKAILGGTYTYQQALDVTDATAPIQIPYTPTNTVAVNMGIFNSNWGIYYNQVYTTDRYYIDDNSPEYKVPGFAVGDVSAVYNFLKGYKPLRIEGGINNVFNTSYSVVRSFPMPGRSFRLSMQITI